MRMRNAGRVVHGVACAFLLCGLARAGESPRRIVLPSPQLIHCHGAGCSQLWKSEPNDDAAVYPAQVLTDLVNGEIVGLTAVYDKSVSTEELRDAVVKLAGKSPLWHSDSGAGWRIESEQLALSVFDGVDGAKQVVYLKFGTLQSLTPSAHFDCQKPQSGWVAVAKDPFVVAGAVVFLIVLGWFVWRRSGRMRRVELGKR